MSPLFRRRSAQLLLVLGGCLALSRFQPASPGTAAPSDADSTPRFHTTRESRVALPMPDEDESFLFAIFGDRTGGPPEGIEVLKDVVAETNLIDPDLVMTVGDLVQGYNQAPEWLVQMREYKGVMDELGCPWFPVAGNHDVYWRGPNGVSPPAGEHEANYEAHFGPLWYAFRHKDCWFVALYSDEGDPETGRKSFSEPACQQMSLEQLVFLEETLERARDARHVFVFLHHPRWLKGGYGDDWDRVHELLADAGNVRAVFAGHIHHMRYDGERDGIEYFTLATIGGGQSGVVPNAGYLHQYHLVTVRDDGLDVSCYPAGSALDPRAITGEVAEEARAVAERMRPRFAQVAELRPDLGVSGRFAFELTNPSSRPVEVALRPESADSRWSFGPDHLHGVILPGHSATFELDAERTPAGLDDSYREPRVAMSIDYLVDDWRLGFPERAFALPVDPEGLVAPPVPATEQVLALDGVRDHLRIADDKLDLPDGPFTVECWMAADEYRDRQGLVNKTQGSEFGFFVNRGVPQYMVHLNGEYIIAEAPRALLEAGRWHHLAGVFDGGEVRLYVDGQQVATKSGGGPRTRNGLPLLIGADVGGVGNVESPFPGRIDEVRISLGALYTGERFEPARRVDPDEATVLLLHMDGVFGPWLYDSSAAKAHPVRRGGARVIASGAR